MPTLTGVLYVLGCMILYVTFVVVLGVLVYVAWFVFVVLVLHGLGCNGACNGVGRFTRDYALLIIAGATTVVGLLLLPVYRRLIREDQAGRMGTNGH